MMTPVEKKKTDLDRVLLEERHANVKMLLLSQNHRQLQQIRS